MNNQEEQKILLNSNSFHRKDLTPEVRFKIASIALFFSHYGTKTKLSQKYNISRTFVYNLKESLNNLCKIPEKKPKLTRQDALLMSYEVALLLRLKGRCGINSISEIMKYFNISHSSVGAISEHLKFAGDSLDNFIDKQDNITYVIFASDEIYSKQRPILITCDPVSTAILHIKLTDRLTSKEWESEWTELKNKSNIVPLYLTKDEGKQMECARAEMYPDINVQSDTYHGVAHKLGLWHKRLEKNAYKKIEKEYKIEASLLTAKTEETLLKRRLAYKQAREETNKALDILEDFEFIYYNLLSCFECIDSNGELKNKKQVIEKFETTLELGIECIKQDVILKRLKSIRKIQKKLFYFYDVARNILQELKKESSDFVLELICLYWQINKRYIKTKNSKTAKKIKQYENTILTDIKELIGDNFDNIFDKTIKKLNNIIQSSSIIECINSILRPYLNSCKNQPTQKSLNLFKFYHNHRRFKAGKRKGKTPIELFTGTKQKDDWLKLLMNKVKIKLNKIK